MCDPLIASDQSPGATPGIGCLVTVTPDPTTETPEPGPRPE